MFEVGNLFYFKDYIFKNGNPPKNKFFLVLKTIEKGFIAAILPTKVESLPSNIKKNHGCISFPDNDFYLVSISLLINYFSYELYIYISFLNDMPTYYMLLLPCI